MIQGKTDDWRNVKTRRETGLDYVMFSLDLKHAVRQKNN